MALRVDWKQRAGEARTAEQITALLTEMEHSTGDFSNQAFASQLLWAKAVNLRLGDVEARLSKLEKNPDRINFWDGPDL